VVVFKKILPLFSYIFHPLFTAFFATAFYFSITSKFYVWQEIFLYSIQVVLLTLLLPLSIFFLLLSTGKIDSIMVENKSQRKTPLILNASLLLILILKSITYDKVPELFFFFLGGIISSLLALLFLYFDKKISIHLIGISALTCFIIGISLAFEVDLLYTISFFIVMIGMVASSRLVMNAHNSAEIVLGFLAGSIPQIILFYFWL